MTNKNDISPWEEAQRCFDEIQTLHGWDLATLASQAGYRLETLQKARREHGGVTFNARMREAIYAASSREQERRKFAESSGTYRVQTYTPGEPSSTQIIEVHEPSLDESVQELRELAADFLTASVFGRRRLMERIDEIIAMMRATIPAEKKAHRQTETQR